MRGNNIISRVFNNFKYAFSSLFYKKDKSIVLFGSWFGEKFADNSRFMYQYLAENKSQLGLSHVVWVSSEEALVSMLNDMGYEAYLMGSDKSKEYHKKAYYHIICNANQKQILQDKNGVKHLINADIEAEYSYRAKRINLWHGTGGLKAVSMATNAYKKLRAAHPLRYKIKEYFLYHSKIYQLFFLYDGGWGRCYQLVTSPLQRETLFQTWGRLREMCIETSYPRNCDCPRLLPNEERVLEEMRKYDSIILYLPTFRTNSSYQYEDISCFLKDIFVANNILWIEKSHSAEKVFVSRETFDTNVIKLDPSFDINTILPYITMLITDYSSVRMDAMYHDKATLFYVPDFEEYCNGDNGFMANPDEVLCGPKLKNVEELRSAIITYIKEPDKSKTDNYQVIKDRYWSKHMDLDQIWQAIKFAVN